MNKSLQQLDARWRHPGATNDRLFENSYRHKHRDHYQTPETTCICAECELSSDPVCDDALEYDCDNIGCSGRLILRNRLAVPDPPCKLHFGSLASGDAVIKSGEHRERLAKKAKVIGFEMEGAGICDTLHCLIIKGVCDYADSHKDKKWQGYAAATAASCTKAFLEVLSATMKEGMPLATTDYKHHLHNSDLSKMNRFLELGRGFQVI